MRKYVFLALILNAFSSAFAQEVTAPEPEFINSYCILTSDSTYDKLPKETGTIGKHENKTKKWSKMLGNVADVAGAGALGVGLASGAGSGLATGIKVMSAANSVSSAAGAVSGLAGYAGMDVIFNGGQSSYTVESGKDIRLLVRGEKNDTDPLDTYRIVRFNASKKDRRVQWMEFESSMLGGEDAKKGGYLNFSGHKYGEQSYLLTIPASELEAGEYGIFFLSVAAATTIPVGTFSVK